MLNHLFKPFYNDAIRVFIVVIFHNIGVVEASHKTIVHLTPSLNILKAL
jgi:hypothetical protein